MGNAELATLIWFYVTFSGSICPVCHRAIVTLDELKRARWGHPPDVVHAQCWLKYIERNPPQ
jgi:hypothetical protein